MAEGLNKLHLGTDVIPLVEDVRSSEAQASLLDVDLVLNGTDTHSSRAALSELCVRAAIPLVDLGVRVGTRASGGLDALLVERRVQVPGGPCLWCWGKLDPETIRLELMAPEERDALLEEGYISGAPGEPVASIAALTVTAAGAAATALLALLAGSLEQAPLGISLEALTMESRPFERQTHCRPFPVRLPAMPENEKKAKQQSYWNVEPVERFTVNYKKTPPTGQKPATTKRKRRDRPRPD